MVANGCHGKRGTRRRTCSRTDLLELIQRCYFEEMKPAVGEEQLAALRIPTRLPGADPLGGSGRAR